MRPSTVTKAMSYLKNGIFYNKVEHTTLSTTFLSAKSEIKETKGIDEQVKIEFSQKISNKKLKFLKNKNM